MADNSWETVPSKKGKSKAERNAPVVEVAAAASASAAANREEAEKAAAFIVELIKKKNMYKKSNSAAGYRLYRNTLNELERLGANVKSEQTQLRRLNEAYEDALRKEEEKQLFENLYKIIKQMDLIYIKGTTYYTHNQIDDILVNLENILNRLKDKFNIDYKISVNPFKKLQNYSKTYSGSKENHDKAYTEIDDELVKLAAIFNPPTIDTETEAEAGGWAEAAAGAAGVGAAAPPVIPNLNAYEILGIEPGANIKTITAAYRGLARVHHPDKGGNVEKFKEIQGAYNRLTMKNGGAKRLTRKLHGARRLRKMTHKKKV